MNPLENETSPYLLQHADNPVTWYPWGEEALAKARQENKPILLSIGYSACHWCHVMAHESFEDADIAAIMNEHFISIKVDREERPDLDKIYQSAHYVLTQKNGGWPLTMFLTPNDHVPFLGGTYFPPQARHGLPGFGELLERVATAYRERASDIEQQNIEVMAALNQLQASPPADAASLNETPILTAQMQAQRAFDKHLGGFGRAPKFPHPSGLERLLRDSQLAIGDAEQAQHMAQFSLARMAYGGIFDHLGGGFFRYSTDNQWMIPHFEKMLYDNGPLLNVYAQAWQLSGEACFSRAVDETIAWLNREMRSPSGGFYASIDADSEGREGAFYVWQANDVRRILNSENYEAFARRYGLTREANFETHWHLRLVAEFGEIANVIGGTPEALEQSVDQDRKTLFAHRETRERPSRDDKILCAWNALVIKGLAIAGRVFDRDDAIDMASQAVDAIRGALFHEGRLYASTMDGRRGSRAYLDDYAFLIDALLHLLEARWRTSDLDFAIELADLMLLHFEDHKEGGFFYTAHDHETLIQRLKPTTDDALPAGNGVAAMALARLGRLVGSETYLNASVRTLEFAWQAIEGAPLAHNALLLALEEYLHPSTTVVIRGKNEALGQWHRRLAQDYRPQTLSFAIPHDADGLPPYLDQFAPAAGTLAYVCQHLHCLPPINDLQQLLDALDTPR